LHPPYTQKLFGPTGRPFKKTGGEAFNYINVPFVGVGHTNYKKYGNKKNNVPKGLVNHQTGLVKSINDTRRTIVTTTREIPTYRK
jgi:hypothetical protein